MKKISWYELHNATPKELKAKYRMNDRQLEQSVRRHMDGANPVERRQLYENIWNKK